MAAFILTIDRVDGVFHMSHPNSSRTWVGKDFELLGSHAVAVAVEGSIGDYKWCLKETPHETGARPLEADSVRSQAPRWSGSHMERRGPSEAR